MQHPSLIKWEQKLRRTLDKIDDHLEDEYGKLYPRHPARARRGATSSKKQDGLFSIGAAFSLGIGSKHGRGYAVDVRMVTLSRVDPAVRKEIETEAEFLLRGELSRQFPGKDLKVARDGRVLRIHGDLSLGSSH